MKIGISGASGQLGVSLVKHLQARQTGAKLVGISRTADRVAALGIEARFGDYDKPESLISAYAGLDKLVIIPGNDLTPGKRRTQHASAIDVAVNAGVEHVVFVSAAGARAARPLSLMESYFQPEQRLMRTAKQWTVLRMAYYAESFAAQAAMGLPHGVHTSFAPTPVNFVSREDVAAAAAGIVASGKHHGAIYHATGPASLGGNERAAAIANASGKPMSFKRVSTEQYRRDLETAGLPTHVIEALMEIQQCWADGEMDVTTGDVERLSGKRPRNLADVLARLA